MKKEKIKKSCKHLWHFMGRGDNTELRFVHRGIAGFLPEFEISKEGIKSHAEFICERCGKTKKILIKE